MACSGRFFDEFGAFWESFWEDLVMFLEQKSEKGEVCLDCAGVDGSHVGLSRERSFSVSSLIVMRSLFSNALLERISPDSVQNCLKN